MVDTSSSAPAQPLGAGSTAPVPDDERAPRRTIVLILVAALGLYISQLTLGSALALRIATVAPQAKEAALGLALTTSSLLLLASVPLSGALSDRTAGRFGRRRPWILGGLLPCLAATAVIGTTRSIPVVVACYVLALICMNAAFNAFTALPVELVPDGQRARVMGMMGMFGAISMTLGNYLASGLVGHQLLMMTAPVAIALVLSLPLLLVLNEPVVDRADLPPFSVRELASSFWINPVRFPDFGWAWLSRFLAGFAMAGMFSYMFYFLMDGIGMTVPQAGAKAALLSLVSMPVLIATFTLSGVVSDKVRRRKPFVVTAALLMTTALLISALAHTFPVYLAAFLLFSVGQATYLTVDLALCAAVLPDLRDTGKGMAVISLAFSLTNTVVPAVAPTLLAVGGGHNYPLLFSVCGGLCLLGALAVRPVRGVR